jgi:chemotaxis protein CheD
MTTSNALVRRIVGIADMQVSADPADLLITYALGSCLGITVHDPVVGVGGLLHVMLPEASIDAQKARENPLMFVDLGVPLLFRRAYALGAKKERIVAKVAGGATTGPTDAEDRFQIGKRNFVKLRELFWKNGVMLSGHEVGGRVSRTLSLNVGTGEVVLKADGLEIAL